MFVLFLQFIFLVNLYLIIRLLTINILRVHENVIYSAIFFLQLNIFDAILLIQQLGS